MKSVVIMISQHGLDLYRAIVRFQDGTGVTATFLSEAGANDWCLRQHQTRRRAA